MDHLLNIELKNSYFPAKTLWPNWPDNVWMHLFGQIEMARLARKWPDLDKTSLPIAVLSDGLVRILQNGSLRHCRITVFIVRQSFSTFFILSYRDRFFNSNLPIGHSIGQFVLDSHLALKRHFYRTFSIWHLAKSYLMDILNSTTTAIINHCKSTYCLFDGYLIDRTYYPYKTPKPLDQSGFFSFLFFKRYQVELIQSQRDETFVIGLNVQKLSSRGATLKTCL